MLKRKDTKGFTEYITFKLYLQGLELDSKKSVKGLLGIGSKMSKGIEAQWHI